MKSGLTPDDKGYRLSEYRKKEMLKVLCGDMNRLLGRKQGKITRMLGIAWQFVAIVFIALCASWLIMPGVFHKHTPVQNDVRSPMTATPEELLEFQEREALDMKIYEMNCELEDSLDQIIDIMDRDLTGF